MVWKGNPNGDHLAPCLVKLIDEIDARAPGRDRRSDGSIGDAAHRSRRSDHNPDANGVVRALDVTDDPSHFDPDDFAEELRRRREPRVKYVISDGRIFASYDTSHRPAWTWGEYTGSNSHHAHVHFSTWPGADDDTRTWFPEEPDPEEFELNPIALVLLTYNACLGRNPESLDVIDRYVKAIKAKNDGGHSFVNAVANSAEAKQYRKRQAVAGVDRVRSDAEIVEVVRKALGD